MASGGYPESYETGRRIHGIEDAEKIDGVHVFHAGTRLEGNHVVTSGGRVLGVTALATDLAGARRRAYEAVSCIEWADEQHRNDIASDAVERLARGVNS